MMVWGTVVQIAPRIDSVLRRRGRSPKGKSAGVWIMQLLWPVAVGFMGVDAVRERDFWKGVQAVFLGVLFLLVLAGELWIRAREKEEMKTEQGEETGEKGSQIVDSEVA